MWDVRYAEPGFAYGTDPNTFLVEQASHLVPPLDVLCLAEGEGRNAVFLAAAGHRVTGVDASAVGLSKAADLARTRGVPLRTVQADLATWDPGEACWDVIVSIWCHLPPAVRCAVHARVVRALRPGGVLLLEAYTPDQVALRTGGPPDPAMCMTVDGLRDELAGLDFELCRVLRRDVHEGRYHHGPSAVVQVRARRSG